MFKPSESALDLYRRVAVPVTQQTFTLRNCSTVRDSNRISRDQVALRFGHDAVAEIQTAREDIPEVVLTAAAEFATQFHDGMIFHLSISNSIYNTLVHSGINIDGSALSTAHVEDRFKSIVVQSLVELLAAVELLRANIHDMHCLILFEGLTPIFLVEKNEDATKPPSALTQTVLQSVVSLCKSHNAIGLFINSAQSGRLSGSLRDGSIARDALAALWKRSVPKLIFA